MNGYNDNDPRQDGRIPTESEQRMEAQRLGNASEGQEGQYVPPQQGKAEEPYTPYQQPMRPTDWQPAPRMEQRPEQPSDPWRQPSDPPRYNSVPSQPYGSQPSPDPKPPKKKSHGKKVVIGLSAVAAACLLFAGGAVIGSRVGNYLGSSGVSEDASTSNSASQQTFGNSNMPMIQISDIPETSSSSDSYDLGDGLPGEEIYKKVNPSIVSVISTNLDGSGGSGSGVIMSEDGYIITNNHVVVDENTGAEVDKVTVQLDDGTQLPAAIQGRDTKTDLAVLKVEPESKLQAAEFGDSDKLQPGEYAYAIGSPGGVELANTITGGRISAINRDITVNDRVMSLIQTDASINPGNSGGALINKYGQVVGITSAKLGISYYEGLGFAIPMSTVKEVVDELIVNGYVVGRPSIGITGWNIPEREASAAKVPQGVYVESIDERAAAYNEGLQRKDIITQVNGQDITTMDEINTIKEDLKAGDQITLRVYRMSTGKFVDLTITLTDEHDLEQETSSQQSDEEEQWGDGGYSRYSEYEDPFSYFFGW